jgi:hypothetical protein
MTDILLDIGFFFAGAAAGVFVAALCCAAGRADE